MTDHKRQFHAIKGTRDILPPDSALWNWFEQTARDVFESYNFRDIRLPIFEETELFDRSVGEETDIVSKEMYHIESSVEIARRMLGGETKWPTVVRDSSRHSQFVAVLSMFVILSKAALESGEISASNENVSVVRRLEEINQSAVKLNPTLEPSKEPERQAVRQEVAMLVNQFNSESLSLRPEATASVVRAYIENGMQTLPGNVKLYYIGPMFRRERPQKGRYRQFYQIGAEVLGQSDAPAIDAEVLEMLVVFFKRVGLTRTTLYVNSIGCKECRPKYVEVLREKLREVKDQLGPDSQRRIDTNPLRVLDSKLPEEQPTIAKLPRISDHLCADCREHFAKLKEELNMRGVAYEENWRLVRGLDYYTRTTFEVTAEGLGSQNAVCGGGRYDGLVELLGGPPTKGIGFAIGSDRAILSIQEGGKLPPLPGLAVFVAWMGQAAYPTAVSITRKLRTAELAVELPPEEMKFKKSLGLADKLGARYALIIGEDEVAAGTFTLKRLADSDQKKLSELELLEYLESERRGRG
jgi:histidyl-tRNA synthetase